ncbi:hypothetical protein H0H81_000063 [Sphagnurus paluster]|uniref:Uncharacterized protein n=1 Tax=Sphagnurus paluster TaxID=117069 RepID=A0A9P7GPP3_9AGAR|nr:hypothetical protein H0H81_000063 [Sphagnurus paluster]
MASEPPLSPVSHQPPAPAKQPNMGMSPASRYQHNLKVLRRRDPSIVSIFDQFSHVCLYHHNGTKWEKQGYEGSMFLYEREEYPPYGFYILNRMGMDDHIQRLYPEDNIGAHGSYLIIRSYPEFTERRLSIARTAASHMSPKPHKYSDIYSIPHVDQLTAADKGESATIGLWMFATDSREPLIDIFTRLHSYIKKNEPYPQEFRYGPDRPPPSIPVTTAAIAGTPSHTHAQPNKLANGSSHQGHFKASHPGQAYANGNGGGSEIDKLFANAKVEPTPASPTASTSQSPNSTSKITVQSLFAALGGGVSKQNADHRTPSVTGYRASSTTSLPSPSASSSTSSGLSLLDSIFASASASASRPATTQVNIQAAPPPLASAPTSSAASVTIFSPAPTTTSVPQILNQDVIATLLGLPPSRSASAASTAYSTGAQSHPSSRGGDDEGSRAASSRSNSGSDEDGYSESSTVLDPEAEYDEELQAAGASAGRPLLAEYNFLGTNGHTNGHAHGQNGRVLGDVTPRPPTGGFVTPPFSRHSTYPQPNGHNNHSGRLSAPMLEHSLSTATVTGNRSQSQPLMRATAPYQSSTPPPVAAAPAPAAAPPPSGVPLGSERALVPFEPDSELWPYPRTQSGLPEDGDDIIELDFADTSALSDPEAFAARRAHRRGPSASSNPNTNTIEGGIGALLSAGTERRKTRRKGRKEKEQARLREREEIENSWDVPGGGAAAAPIASASGQNGNGHNHNGHGNGNGHGLGYAAVNGNGNGHAYEYEHRYGTYTQGERRLPSTASPSPCPSPELQPADSASAAREAQAPAPKQILKKAVNGTSAPKVQVPAAPVDPVRDSVLAAVADKGPSAPALARNDFVREVLMLIHVRIFLHLGFHILNSGIFQTDKAFVDSMYQEYTSRIR